MATIAEVDATPEGVASRRRGWTPGPRQWQPEPSAWTGVMLTAPFLVILLLFVVYPFIRLIETALGPPDGFGNLTSFFANRANVAVVEITFRDAAIVTALSLTGGGLIAWALKVSTSRLMRALLLSAVFVPFWMGSVVKIYAFSALLGRTGVANSVLLNLHLINAPLELLYTQAAVVIGMFYQMLPFGVLPMYVAFSAIETDLILAAESSGASRARALFDVVLPLAVPGILATIIINYVIAIGFYLTPVLLGGATQPFTASLIQEDLFSFSDFAGASIGGALLLFGGVLVVVIGYFLVGKERLRRAISG